MKTPRVIAALKNYPKGFLSRFLCLFDAHKRGEF